MTNNLSLFPKKAQKYIPIVLSLKEKWLESMLEGKKQYEFRRQFLEEPTCAFIYLTYPVSCISHVVWFDEPVIGSPEEIVKLKEKNKESLRKYLKKCKRVYAAPVQQIRELKKIDLEKIREKVGKFYPPQLYLRLQNHPELIELLMKRAEGKVEKNTFSPA